MMTMKYGLIYRFFLLIILCVSVTSSDHGDLMDTVEKRMNPTGNEEPPNSILQNVAPNDDSSHGTILGERSMPEDIASKADKEERSKESDGKSASMLQEITNSDESQEPKELEEEDTWFVTDMEPSAVMWRSPSCADIDNPELSHGTMPLPPFLCDDLTTAENEEKTRQVRRTFKPRPVMQYRHPTTHDVVTLIRPPSQQEYNRGGHFYLGTQLKDRFYDPDTVEEGNDIFKSIPCRCGLSTYNSNFRIVSGWDIKPHAYPFLVSVQNLTQHHFCGGMIICNSFVLTAAHCVQGAMPDEILVQIGDHDISPSTTDKLQSPFQKTAKVHSIITNFQYKPKSKDYDMALLRLKDDIRFNKHVGAVCLPDPLEVELDSQEARVVGWGVTEHGSKKISKTPKETKVKTMSKKRCIQMSHFDDTKITDTMMCASGKNTDACQGDSGGPLLWKRYTSSTKSIRIDEVSIGIVSWGKGCASKHYPGVYTDLTNPETLEWIYANTKSCHYCQ